MKITKKCVGCKKSFIMNTFPSLAKNKYCSRKCFYKNNDYAHVAKFHPKTHGMSRTKIYGVWHSMKGRCDNKNDPSFKHYGARGIIYDPRWKLFENFYSDMKEGYFDGLSLDRIDNNGNYEKANCRWATTLVQNRNMRTTSNVHINGKKISIAELEEKYGINRCTIKYRIERMGLTAQEALLHKKHKHAK